MDTIYLKTRAKITEKMNECTANGYTCFRVRVGCLCIDHHSTKGLKNPEAYPKANQRNGLLVIDGDKVVSLFVKCGICGEQPEPETE
jgi:hypothetical protein